MNPDSQPPAQFGRTPAQVARGALVLTAIGWLFVFILSRVLLRPGTGLADRLESAGVPPVGLVIGASAAAAALGLYVYIQSIRQAPRFRLTPAGLEVTGTLGEYTVRWENLRDLGVTPGGALGLRVHSRDAIAETHAGTPEQRERLRALPPYGDWDYFYPVADLGHPAETVAGWITDRASVR
jgi:hypothetical protein